MRYKLYAKLFISTAVAVLFGFVLLVGVLVYGFSAKMETERLDLLREEAVSIADSLKSSDQTQNYSDELKRMAVAFSKGSGSSVFFVNRSGLVTICSDTLNHEKCVHSGATLDSEILYAVFVRGRFESTGDFAGLYDSDHYVVGVPIVGSGGAYDMAVFVSSEVQNHNEHILEILAFSLLPACIVLLVIYVIIFSISCSMSRPLKEMAEATKAMAKGDFSKRVSDTRKDEIGDLARSFNKMAESLGALDYMSNSFVTNVSHDLKTPITTISGFVDGILDGTIPPDQQKKYLSIVSVEIKRLSNTVNTMLNLAKIESGMAQLNCCTVDLTDVVCRVAVSFEYSLSDKDIDVIGLDTAGKVYVECDEGMMYQAIYNLFDNAVKFTQRGGFISVSFSENNSEVMLYIKNSGSGIPEKDMAHIFERFYKTDKSRSQDKYGAGVGLYIVRNIICGHGGDITAKSVEGQYTQFCITLPKIHNTTMLRDRDGEAGRKDL